MDAANSDRHAIDTDITVLIESLTVGVLRLDRRRRIELANNAAHTFLDRAPGTLIGLSAVAAFLDARLEAVVDEAERTGSAGDEVDLSGTPFTLVARGRRAAGGECG